MRCKFVKSKQKRSGFSRARRRGAVTAVVALSVVVLMAFTALAVDYGILVTTKNQLQRACDAAALAGVAQLKRTNDDYDIVSARYYAYHAALQNGVAVDANTITFSNNNTEIMVPAARTRTFFFAWAIGLRSGNVAASARAGVGAGDDLVTNTVAPIGITWETYNAYKNSTDEANIRFVRQNKQTFGLDDFVLFDLRDSNAKSGAHMEWQLTGANAEVASIGDYETTLNAAGASQEPKMISGLDTLFERSTASPWNDTDDIGIRYNEILAGTSPRNNPRVAHLIITPSTTIANNGTYNTQIQGFAAVYIESYQWVTVGSTPGGGGKGKGKGKGNSGGEDGTEQVLEVTFRFLPPTSMSDGGAVVNPDAAISGVRVQRLLS